jgi:hypothetical protein
MEKEDVNRSLSKWAHSGFNTSRAKLSQTGQVSPRGTTSIADF